MQQNCPNCGHIVFDAVNFCPACGQKAHTGRLKVANVVGDFSHAMLHTDTSIFSLIWKLAYKPGTVARNYVLGKRKSYYNPFNFLVLIGATSIFVISILGINVGGFSQNTVNNFVSKHYNLIIFFTVPILSYTTYLLFRNKGYNFAECAVLATYTAGLRSIFYITIIAPLTYLFPQYNALLSLCYLIIYFIYYGIACGQFTGKMSAGNFFKGFLAAFLLQICVTVIIMLCTLLYWELKY